MEKNIFGENILFVQAVAQCFLKEKLLQNKQFYAKNAKMAGKGKLYDVIFFKLGALKSKLKLWKNYKCISVQIKQRITVNCWY